MEFRYEKDNKERIPFEHYLAEFEKADPEEISERTLFPWSKEEQCFRVRFLGVNYRIGFPDFSVKPEEETDAYLPLVSMNAARILMLRFLLESRTVAGTGKFLTYREVPWGEVYYRQFNGRCMQRLAFSYGNRLDKFSTVMEKLGARPVPQGDAGYETELFPGFYIRFQLWAGDDEFPPSSQILFGDNFAAVFHAEDLVVACDVIIGTMKNE